MHTSSKLRASSTLPVSLVLPPGSNQAQPPIIVAVGAQGRARLSQEVGQSEGPQHLSQVHTKITTEKHHIWHSQTLAGDRVRSLVRHPERLSGIRQFAVRPVYPVARVCHLGLTHELLQELAANDRAKSPTNPPRVSASEDHGTGPHDNTACPLPLAAREESQGRESSRGCLKSPVVGESNARHTAAATFLSKAPEFQSPGVLSSGKG